MQLKIRTTRFTIPTHAESFADDQSSVEIPQSPEVPDNSKTNSGADGNHGALKKRGRPRKTKNSSVPNQNLALEDEETNSPLQLSSSTPLKERHIINRQQLSLASSLTGEEEATSHQNSIISQTQSSSLDNVNIVIY